MKKFSAAIILAGLIVSPVAFAQVMPGAAQQQRLNDMKDNHDEQGIQPEAGRPAVAPSPTERDRAQQRSNDKIEMERTTGQPGVGQAPRGSMPNPTADEQTKQRLNDKNDKKAE